MKNVLAIVIVIFIVCAGIVLASSSTKVICPACKKEIANGDDMAHRMIDHQLVPVHFKCAYKKLMAPQLSKLEKLAKK